MTNDRTVTLDLNTGIFNSYLRRRVVDSTDAEIYPAFLYPLSSWWSEVTCIHPDTGITVALHAANIITKVIIHYHDHM